MRFLIVNDDGIESEGLVKLARMAAKFGETWVAAPDCQCSGMSQKITINDRIRVTRRDFPVKEVYRAYSCSGTPADCTDIAIKFLMKEEPDYVFSGINRGLNAGFDVAYSGTDGAAMEAVLCGIPAAAFSHSNTDDFEVTDYYLQEIMGKILAKKPYRDRIWNVNIPECTLEKCRGIAWGTRVADAGFFEPAYQLLRAHQPAPEIASACPDVVEKQENRSSAACGAPETSASGSGPFSGTPAFMSGPVSGMPASGSGLTSETPVSGSEESAVETYLLKEAGTRTDPARFAPGTDLHAIMNGYISVGTVNWHGTHENFG